MVQNIIDVNESDDKILNIVKAQQGLKNKSQAIAFILRVYAESFLEPELRPEYLEKLRELEKGSFSKTFSSIEEFRRHIESN